MARILRLAWVLLLVASTSGLASAAQVLIERAEPACCADEEPSHDDDEGCPPSCTACARPLPVVAAPAPTVEQHALVRLVALPLDHVPAIPKDPPARGVFHPPRISR